MVQDLPKKLHFDALSNLVWKISLQEGKDVTNVKARASFYDQPAAKPLPLQHRRTNSIREGIVPTKVGR